MIFPDYRNRSYTAEVLRVEKGMDKVFDAVSRLTVAPKDETITQDENNDGVKIFHGFTATPHDKPFHRSSQLVVGPDGKKISLPRIKQIRNKSHYLYDVIIAVRKNHLLVAVPFHGLAQKFFVKVDNAIAGVGAEYEVLDIGNLVVKLGADGQTEVLAPNSTDSFVIFLTRCHLSYYNQKKRKQDLESVKMSGRNLGVSPVYTSLITPVLEGSESDWIIKPVLLGVSVSVNGVKKSSITTDRHGNFKIHVGPGLRQVERVFNLLEILDSMNDVTSSSINVPILQSNAIREIEE